MEGDFSSETALIVGLAKPARHDWQMIVQLLHFSEYCHRSITQK
jgi:hypothetical protein